MGGGKDKYENERIGINGRLDTVQAAFLLEKIEIFDDELKRREKVARYYTQNIHKTFTSPLIPSKYFSSWAQYSILIPDKLDRNKVIDSLRKEKIPSMVYYKIPAHLQKAYEKYGYSRGEFQISEKISNSILSLPMHPYLDKEDQYHIISELNKYS
jgi:Predicted pyridoxal phosphate-dependent enzyme apparently involved in regulation of cell wall biogenesis